MAQGTGPCVPCHWVMGCPVWTLTMTSHNRVVYKICPNTDVACTIGVLHLVWPLSQSLCSMVEPTRRTAHWFSDRNTSQQGHHQLEHLPLGRIYQKVWSLFWLWVCGTLDILTQKQAVCLSEGLEWCHIASGVCKAHNCDKVTALWRVWTCVY